MKVAFYYYLQMNFELVQYSCITLVKKLHNFYFQFSPPPKKPDFVDLSPSLKQDTVNKAKWIIDHFGYVNNSKSIEIRLLLSNEVL